MQPYPWSPPGRARLQVVDQDITTMAVDAICNSASRSLRGGGGVDGAIHRAAGPQLAAACRQIGGCEIGDAVVTPGFRLPASMIIHTAAPVLRKGTQEEWALLASCFRSSLLLADKHGALSMVFSAIGCGVRGFSPTKTADLAIQTIAETLAECRSVSVVIFSCPDKQAHSEFSRSISLAPKEIPTAEIWKNNWREAPLKRRQYWIRKHTLNESHWAAISSEKGRESLVFFSEAGVVFDQVSLNSRRREGAALRKLGFEPWTPGASPGPSHPRPRWGEQDPIYSTILATPTAARTRAVP